MAGTNPAFSQTASAMITTSTTVATTTIGTSGDTAVVSNQSTGNLYVNFDGTGVTVTATTGYCVPANTQRVIAVSTLATNVAVILDASTGKAYVERGFGAAR